ncbi:MULTISPECIES: DUF6527 family protein [Enterobacterales]|jgi:hypothetical protein|uniref:DUF6527 family protein n=1 Tax=Enterobacterales TaxID=91347 RepID=UPI0008FFB70C|nr:MULTISPECIES: DUF6527 family protein [Enterobacterales]EMA4456299.1 hypothetical protein [Citrobacter freundii]HDL8324635.1 hypothetical protein [Yersinia enterocolitica]EKV0504960.1 hypothetical protein [Raoultella ornithinolytica]EKW7679641.1 hypothetical protein [Raoultella ornithinolytica]ELN4410610.1 hypothetical protein [Raoultella ornithinolytica]
MKTFTIKLVEVDSMPRDLEPNTLYYSERFGTASHLCACGCGAKIRTPIDVNEWSIVKTEQGPTLHPSVGNWQKECKSHYYIRKGKIVWCGAWTEKQIQEGRYREQQARIDHYNRIYSKQSVFNKIWLWIKDKLGL